MAGFVQQNTRQEKDGKQRHGNLGLAGQEQKNHLDLTVQGALQEQQRPQQQEQPEKTIQRWDALPRYAAAA